VQHAYLCSLISCV